MELQKYRDRYSLLRRLRHNAVTTMDILGEKLKNEYDETGDVAQDYYDVTRLALMLHTLCKLLDAERCFLLSILDIDDEKSKFIVQKNMRDFIKETLYDELTDLLHCAKTWEFSDYRARRLQDDLRRDMESLCDWYKKEYLSDS